MTSGERGERESDRERDRERESERERERRGEIESLWRFDWFCICWYLFVFVGTYLYKSQPKMFTCDVCGVTIKHISNYYRHRRRHDKSPAKAKPHKCGVCGKTFRDKSELGNHLQSGAHMTLATSVQRYTCATCGGCFTSQRALLHHSHSKERTFPCDICQRRFQTAVVCTAHRRRHFWRSLPRCRACGATFAAEAHLTRHIRNHESETSEVVRY